MEYSNWHPDEPNPGDTFQEKSICLILRKHDTTGEWKWYDENYDKATSIIYQVPSTTTTMPTYTSKSSIEPSTSKDRSTPQTDGLSTDVVSSSSSSEGFSTQSSLTMTTINPASSRNNALLIGLTVPFSVLIVTTLIVIAFVVIKRRKTRSDDKGTMDSDGDDCSMIDVKNVAYESVMNLSPVAVDDEHDTKRNHSAEQNIYTQHEVDDTGVFIDTHNIIYEPYDTTGNNEESKTNQ
ncbi:uncharacterized protein [Ptychodera flava]|uniref:uncharacterized protein isoform X2 n=1 Tax=Ptychodera flava TaxID=63121 RepID=UPI003969E397